MFLYRCASCGSDRVQLRSVNEGFSYGKAAAGVFLFGTVGAVAGMAGKETTKYFCPRCGQTLDYPMSATTAMNIDMALMKRYDPSNESTLKMYKRMYPGIDWDYPREEGTNANVVQVVKERAPINPNATTESLLQRIEDFIEDGDWDNADYYCGFLLDKEPSNPEVYKKKILIENQTTDIYELGFKLDAETRSLEGSSYNKLIKYGGEDGQKWAEEIEDIKSEFLMRRIKARKEEEYNKLVEKVNLNSSIDELKKTADELKKLIPFQESEKYYNECLSLITQIEEETRRRYEEEQKAKAAQEKEQEYQTWIGIVDAPKSKVDDLNRAIAGLEAMGDYKERSAYIQKALGAVSEAENATKRRKEILKTTVRVCGCIAFLLVVGVFVVKLVISPAIRYHQASNMMNNQKYESAYIEFQDLGNYKDSKQKAEESLYLYANQLYEQERYEEALQEFQKLSEIPYEDAEQKLFEVKKVLAVQAFDKGEYDKMISYYEEFASDYEGMADSPQFKKAMYLAGVYIANKGKYYEASKLFELAKGYEDADELLKKCLYLMERDQ